MLPPRRRTPAAVSVPAEKERARNWEERKQQSNWAQSRPTHGSERSPNRTHNNTQGNHEVRALQQPPNAAHAERAISKHPPPSLYKVPTYSTKGGGVPGQPLLNRHQVGGVSRSPDGLFAQQEREPIGGRPAVKGKRTYGGRPGQRVEEQGTWASRTRKHSEAG